jgi:archaellum biogenesis ATPase FlaH
VALSAELATDIVCKTPDGKTLDASQRAIVLDALTTIGRSEQLLLFLHGPPGTGKSVVSNAIIRGQKLMNHHMWAAVDSAVTRRGSVATGITAASTVRRSRA